MATNSFGLDAAYFSDKLSLVLRDLGHFTPEELARALARMARTACEGVLGEAEFTVQAAPTCAAQDGDAQLDAMRRSGLSIDGDNAYKRDLIDCIVGALMLGKQGVNPPPAGHWLEQFWQTARGEGEIQEQLAAAPAAPVAQEPMAFAVVAGGKVRNMSVYRELSETFAKAWNSGGMDDIAEVVPLYAAPPAADQPNSTTTYCCPRCGAAVEPPAAWSYQVHCQACGKSSAASAAAEQEGAAMVPRELPEDDIERRVASGHLRCTCPSGDGSLRWPCPAHPPSVSRT